jgi:hypothetical protein
MENGGVLQPFNSLGLTISKITVIILVKTPPTESRN